MGFKLLLRAETISNTSAGFSKAEFCQSPVPVLTVLLGGYLKQPAKQKKGVSHFPSSEIAMQTHQTPHGKASLEIAGYVAYVLCGFESIKSAETACCA